MDDRMIWWLLAIGLVGHLVVLPILVVLAE